MMYHQKLACAIKVDGKILREFKDVVYIPFGSEYSILVKNLNNRRAVVNVFIDGDNAVPNGLVLGANDEIELERKVVNNNLSEGNRFKFIERTENIENGPRGITLEDGLIRIEHQFEKPLNIHQRFRTSSEWSTHHPDWYKPWNQPYCNAIADTARYNIGGVMRGVDFSNGDYIRKSAAIATSATLNNMGIATNNECHDGLSTMDCCFKNDVGITVQGSKSSQKFTTTTVGELESEKGTMVIRLVGDLGDNKPVTKPVTVKEKPQCVTCGRQNKATAKFCSECGTSLNII